MISGLEWWTELEQWNGNKLDSFDGFCMNIYQEISSTTSKKRPPL